MDPFPRQGTDLSATPPRPPSTSTLAKGGPGPAPRRVLHAALQLKDALIVADPEPRFAVNKQRHEQRMARLEQTRGDACQLRCSVQQIQIAHLTDYIQALLDELTQAEEIARHERQRRISTEQAFLRVDRRRRELEERELRLLNENRSLRAGGAQCTAAHSPSPEPAHADVPIFREVSRIPAPPVAVAYAEMRLKEMDSKISAQAAHSGEQDEIISALRAEIRQLRREASRHTVAAAQLEKQNRAMRLGFPQQFEGYAEKGVQAGDTSGDIFSVPLDEHEQLQKEMCVLREHSEQMKDELREQRRQVAELREVSTDARQYAENKYRNALEQAYSEIARQRQKMERLQRAVSQAVATLPEELQSAFHSCCSGYALPVLVSTAAQTKRAPPVPELSIPRRRFLSSPFAAPFAQSAVDDGSQGATDGAV
eukprot:TRINITY_DN6506_c0_g1_i1.p1 TRINITY_DN6506_c0_g1~~TRINITY_DN6506_c0_g1_i1.p1  ORF type:complete len:426 (+),score=69.61 TRINITY_DN6506_c0_g1_i1:57-1334(+)